MDAIHYTSGLTSDYRPEAESLLFFNPEQHRVREGILRAIELYGEPALVEDQGRLRVVLKSGQEVQVLFALRNTPPRPRLIGVIVYTRADPATLLVLHLAVLPEYSYQGARRNDAVVFQLVAKLREIGARIKGVRVVRLLYGKNHIHEFPVGAP